MTIDWNVRAVDLVKLAAVLVSLTLMYGTLTAKVDEALKTVDATKRQTQRIEHYLSSKDPGYYRAITENGDGER